MTFLRFCFNRNGFGRTNWAAAIWIHAFGAVGVGMALHGEPWALLSLVSVAALWLGTYMNFKGYWR